MKIELDVVVGKNDISGRTYTEETISEAIEKIQYPLMVDSDPDGIEVDLQGLSGTCTDLRIEDNKIFGTFKLNGDVPGGIILESLIENNIGIEFKIAGTGNVNEKLIVSNYDIHKIFVKAL